MRHIATIAHHNKITAIIVYYNEITAIIIYYNETTTIIVYLNRIIASIYSINQGNDIRSRAIAILVYIYSQALNYNT